jgi:hypothetical protein
MTNIHATAAVVPGAETPGHADADANADIWQ